MEVADMCEIVDRFSDSEGTDFFSSRLGALNLSFTSSCDPSFSFNTSSRASSLRHCESTAGSTAAETLPPVPPLLPAVTSTPCASSGRHVVLARRSSLPCAPDYRTSISGCPPRPPGHGLSTETPPSAAAASMGVTRAASLGTRITSVTCALAPLACAGFKRRSFAEPTDVPAMPEPRQVQRAAADGSEEPGGSVQVAEPSSPSSSSFASFAAALAAHYFADYGSVPDHPAHMEEMRKRQRVQSDESVEET